MRSQSVKLFDNFSMSGDGYSNPVNLELITGFSIQNNWTGSPDGYLFLQISNESPAVGNYPTIWTVIPASIINCNTSTTSSLVWKDALAAYRWVRVGFAYNSGSGSLTTNFSAKGLT